MPPTVHFLRDSSQIMGCTRNQVFIVKCKWLIYFFLISWKCVHDICEVPPEKFKCLRTLLLFFLHCVHYSDLKFKINVNDTFNWYAFVSFSTQVGFFNHKSTCNIKYLGTAGGSETNDW